MVRDQNRQFFGYEVQGNPVGFIMVDSPSKYERDLGYGRPDYGLYWDIAATSNAIVYVLINDMGLLHLYKSLPDGESPVE